LIAKAKHEQLMRGDPAYREEHERKLRNTKPVYYLDTSSHRRPVLVVGGRGMWYEDMKEKAERLKEKPNPGQDPHFGMVRDVKADVSVAIDRRQRSDRGTRVFHIANNPLARS
jgi:hypothetical protein